MHRDRVVARVVHTVRLVQGEAGGRRQAAHLDQKRPGEATVAVAAEAHLPGPFHPLCQPRREAVDGHQRLRGSGIEDRRDGRVERAMDRREARCSLGLAQVEIGRYRGAIADGRDEVRCMRRTVAVDHQARIGLEHRRRVQPFAQGARQALGPDVEGDVPVHLGARHAQIAQHLGHRTARMLAHQEPGRSGIRAHDREWRRVAGPQQPRCLAQAHDPPSAPRFATARQAVPRGAGQA